MELLLDSKAVLNTSPGAGGMIPAFYITVSKSPQLPSFFFRFLKSTTFHRVTSELCVGRMQVKYKIISKSRSMSNTIPMPPAVWDRLYQRPRGSNPSSCFRNSSAKVRTSSCSNCRPNTSCMFNCKLLIVLEADVFPSKYC